MPTPTTTKSGISLSLPAQFSSPRDLAAAHQHVVWPFVDSQLTRLLQIELKVLPRSRDTPAMKPSCAAWSKGQRGRKMNEA